VSFSGNRASGTYTPLVVSGNSPPRGEPISLATLDRDCFIIPLASLERFLPAGVPVSDQKISLFCLIQNNVLFTEKNYFRIYLGK